MYTDFQLNTFKVVSLLMILLHQGLCWKIESSKDQTAEFFLDGDSEPKASRTLDCGMEKKIILRSYFYNIKNCSNTGCISVLEASLPEITVFEVHRKCSFESKCKDLDFPPPASLQNNQTAVATIIYQCLGNKTQILNLCERHKLEVQNTTYIKFEDNYNNFEKCQCSVNKGHFHLGIVDLRLNEKRKSMCSPTEFSINSQSYLCNPESSTYGAKFGEVFEDKIEHDMLKDAYISLVPMSSNNQPEMVWISITPEADSRIECNTKPISTVSTDMVTPVIQTQSSAKVQDVITSSYLHPDTTAQDHVEQNHPPSDRSNIATVVLGVALGLSVPVIFFLGLGCWVVRRKERKALETSLQELKLQQELRSASLRTQSQEWQVKFGMQAETIERLSALQSVNPANDSGTQTMDASQNNLVTVGVQTTDVVGEEEYRHLPKQQALSPFSLSSDNPAYMNGPIERNTTCASQSEFSSHSDSETEEKLDESLLNNSYSDKSNMERDVENRKDSYDFNALLNIFKTLEQKINLTF